MAEMPQSPAGQPSQAQQPGQPGGQSAPPFGTSPATGPTPNRGYEAAAAQRLGLIVKQLEELLPLAGAASDVGKAALEALNKLVKLVPPGSVTPAAARNNIEQMSMRNTQNNQQMEALKAQRAQSMQGGAQSGQQAA